ncbi:hypothetical protein DSO57_1011003 [Entomophthora muscae]|uniref:Uncharacterized protein n=1 Tax=Entomophthora muscae TaxID=34485 RepID=A0ACC2RLA1_9FUNG|nr:hypothetical protein DSO57_1011003 [Entomophthora muscae]
MLCFTLLSLSLLPVESVPVPGMGQGFDPFLYLPPNQAPYPVGGIFNGYLPSGYAYPEAIAYYPSPYIPSELYSQASPFQQAFKSSAWKPLNSGNQARPVQQVTPSKPRIQTANPKSIADISKKVSTTPKPSPPARLTQARPPTAQRRRVPNPGNPRRRNSRGRRRV